MSKLETNLNLKTIDEKYDFIERWLPARYTTSVNIILKEDVRKPAYIRKVKKKGSLTKKFWMHYTKWHCSTNCKWKPEDVYNLQSYQ
jgi:hypothetical protein